MHGWSKAAEIKSPWIIAHRGYRAKYPENTLIAFQAALDARVTMIELDVMPTRDGKLVIMHDQTIDRTTNGCGPVNSYSLKELKKLDAGSWFSPAFAGQHVPELKEVLELVNGRVLVNIEIKSHIDHSSDSLSAIERHVVEIIKRKKVQDVALVSSFDKNVLEKIASIRNPPALSLISRDPADGATIEFCKRLNVFSWHPAERILSPEQVHAFHAEGFRVFPYNVDTTKHFKRMFDMKVDGVITSDPLLVMDWLRHKKAA
jgi:glycerophosphoryl diester phosphodiesterase